MDEGMMRVPAKIEMHLPGGYTKLLVEAGGMFFDVPTAAIPQHLRKIGTRVLLIYKPATTMATIQEKRSALHDGVVIEELTG